MIRLLRIFKIISADSFLGKLINFIILSVKDLLFYCVILLLFIFIFVIAGRELFAYQINPEYQIDEFGFIIFDSPIRENFNTLIESLITVFILFIGDVNFF
jgi:hypothetical protein